MVGESSEAAQDKVKKESEELTFEIGKESIRDFVAKAKALVTKLEQTSDSTTKKKVNRRILNALPSVFDVEKKVFLMMTGIEPDEQGEALAWIKDSSMRDGSAGGTHAMATSVRPRGNGQGRGGGARRDRGGRGNARGKREAKTINVIIISSSGLPSAQRSSSSRRSISGSHSSSSSNFQDTLAGGDHYVLVSVAASSDISMQNIE